MNRSAESPRSRPESGVRVVAVIDLGATSVRMAIAQIATGGRVETLEYLQQAVDLGKDTFTLGRIEPATTEQCVAALRSFGRTMAEYGISAARDIHAVATSAVREAENRDAFLDRLYIGTGIAVTEIDEAEVNRYTYLAVKPVLDAQAPLRRADCVVVEVGGGSTEFLVLQKGHVALSHSYRLGSLRLREMLEDFRAPAMRLSELLANHIEISVQQIRNSVTFRRPPRMVAMGGDARFAADRLCPGWNRQGIAVVPVEALGRLADEILSLSVDDLVRAYHLPYPNAETLGPALLAYARLAQALGLRQVYVTEATLRDGLLAEMARESWTEAFEKQILRTVDAVGRRYGYEPRHAERVATLAREMFRALAADHRLPDHDELLLTVAAMLHDIGLYVSNRSHHKHSMYLVMNSDIFGLGRRDKLIAALVARYHRRAEPSPEHEGYATLDREGRLAVTKLAAILRVADALDRGQLAGRGGGASVRRESEGLVITITRAADVTIEQFALQQKGGMFERVYGMPVRLRAGAAGEGRT